ncbi:MAG: class I SAM-dependent methyltransferase [Desulfobacteraceae bacterium]|nr:class I SAM-dependent methyltransferase [Desulfobacteraceae bacterium]MBC2755221.1 class I SAM-dependent methyltransferase [Desulfobacteraceae bacterium]
MNRQERYKLFENVYEKNLWGKSISGNKYYSDSPPELTKLYRNYVSNFIKTRCINRVVDLGCGDFEASSGIDMGEAHYIGVDIYDKLIKYNIEHYSDERHEFLVLDIVEDDIPAGDLCLVTLVLYILSFDEVFSILRKLNQFRYVLITDGQADVNPRVRKNIDKKTDKYTRRDYFNNGFYLELPPFELDLTVVCEYQIPSGEIIRTVLLENPYIKSAPIDGYKTRF